MFSYSREQQVVSEFFRLTVFPYAWKTPNIMWHPACTKRPAAYCMDTKRNNLRPAHWSGSKLADRRAIFVISYGPLGLVSGLLLIRDIFSLIDQLLGHRKQWITNEAGNLICHGGEKNENAYEHFFPTIRWCFATAESRCMSIRFHPLLERLLTGGVWF